MILHRASAGMAVLLIAVVVAPLAGQDKTVRFDLTQKSSGVSQAVAFSPDDKVLASTRDMTWLCLWDTRTGKLLGSLDKYAAGIGLGNGTIGVQAFRFSPDGKLLAGGVSFGSVVAGQIFLWDVSDPTRIERKAVLKGHTQGVWAVAFTPDGRTLISASLDQEIKFWDVATAKELRTLKGHKSRILGMALSSDGKRLLTGDPDEVKIWDVATGKVTASCKATKLVGLAISSDDKTLAICTESGTTAIWDLTASPPKLVREIGMKAWTPMALRPGHQQLATANSNRYDAAAVQLWNLDPAAEVVRFPQPDDFVTCLAFSHDGKMLACGGSSGMGRAHLSILNVPGEAKPTR